MKIPEHILSTNPGDKIIVKERPDLVKDRETGALLNTNTRALKEYKIAKMNSRKNLKLQSQVSDMQKEIDELKNLVKGLIK
jgi:hypothetical protein